jgi:hypothetical protein
MKLIVSAGLPGKVRVLADGVEVQLDHSADLYNGLHALAEALDAAAQAPTEPVPAAPSATPADAPTLPEVLDEPSDPEVTQ